VIVDPPHPWAAYISVFLAPFVQEDAAVIGAASAAAMKLGDPLILFLSLMMGLIISDTWKYWLGRYARTHKWAMKFVEKPGVRAAGAAVVKRLGLTLLIARFVPGTRIPTYIASGLFKAPFLPFLAWVAGSGVLYAGGMFLAFHFLGKVFGEQAMKVAPWVALAVVVTVIVWTLAKERLRAAKLKKSADLL
jgi:membrane protein DedA with SNARE-associated domain